MSSYRSTCARVGLGFALGASAPALATVALMLAIAATAGGQPAPVMDCSK